jgi:hypothetical protein
VILVTPAKSLVINKKAGLIDLLTPATVLTSLQNFTLFQLLCGGLSAIADGGDLRNSNRH